MIQAHDAAGDVSARRIVVGAHQRTHAGIGAEDAGRGERRGQLGAFGDKERDFVGGDGNVVAFLEGDVGRSCADDADRVSRHQDIGVGRLAATVDDNIIDAVGKDEKGSLGGIHAHLHAGEFRDVLPPDTAGVDGDGRIVIGLLSRLAVHGMHALDGVSLLDETRHLRVQAHLAATQFSVQHVGRTQAERVYAAVRHLDGANEVRVHGRLHAPGQFGVDDFCADACTAAGIHKGLLVSEVIFRKGDEKAVGLVNAMGGNAAENHVLFNTLLRAFGVVDGIACTGMEKTMVTARGPGSNVGTFYQKGP